MKKLILPICLMLCTLLCACGASTKNSLSGSISTDGSTSMAKVIGALGESFTNENKEVKFTYNPTGSGTGIIAVTEGRCDIGLSSRALKDDEKNAGLTETILAYDGIAVIVHPENSISDLSIEQIADIYTGKITNWSELGGDDSAIVLIGREAGSGTRDGFESVTDTKGECRYRQELTSTGDVIASVAGNKAAIGYASVASIKGTVKAVTVGGVAANESTILDGTYGLQRPFVLATRTGEALSDAAQKFFDYITSAEAAEIIRSSGAVPAAK